MRALILSEFEGDNERTARCGSNCKEVSAISSKVRKLPSGYILGPNQLPAEWVSEVKQLRPEATTHFHLVLGLTL